METLEVRMIRVLILGSYRTYEEWKPIDPDRFTTTKVRSYRTYEEWKLFASFVYSIPDRFLPYLWGMETAVHCCNLVFVF